MSNKKITKTVPTAMPDRPGPVLLDDPRHPKYVKPEPVAVVSAPPAAATPGKTAKTKE